MNKSSASIIKCSFSSHLSSELVYFNHLVVDLIWYKISFVCLCVCVCVRVADLEIPAQFASSQFRLVHDVIGNQEKGLQLHQQENNVCWCRVRREDSIYQLTRNYPSQVSFLMKDCNLKSCMSMTHTTCVKCTLALQSISVHSDH